MARVLIIDDEGLARFTIREILEEWGHYVDEAYHGVHGMRRLATNNYDVVITDMVMPHQDGTDTIREIKRAWPAVRIIATSGSGPSDSSDLLAEALNAGADCVLPKPFSSSDLCRMIDGLVASEVAAEAAPSA